MRRVCFGVFDMGLWFLVFLFVDFCGWLGGNVVVVWVVFFFGFVGVVFSGCCLVG